MNSPQRYRRRHPSVSAVRWLGESNCEEVFAFLGMDHPDDEMDHTLIHFESGNGYASVEPGDWIVADEGGGHSTYSDERFRKDFEPATQTPGTDRAGLPAEWSPAVRDAFWTAVNAPTYEESTAATLAFAQLLPAPAELSDDERTMLTYALNEAQEHIWSRDGFTDEDQAAVTSLRRLAAAPAVVSAVPGQADGEAPRCPHCQLPHDLTPSMQLMCASIRASIADHTTVEQHTGGNAEDCPICRPEIDRTVLYPWICTATEQQPKEA